jgi:cytochrome c556
MLKRILTAAAGALVLVVSAQAQDDSPMSMHGMSQTTDTRQLVNFPPPMRRHMLSNMRGHVEALGEILTALSAGDSAKAATIAETRLGLESPGAAACNPNRGANTSAMATMMAEHMPDEMRTLGFAMHEAASRFAMEAAKAQQSNDMKTALAALSQVTQRCAACHSAYRLN